MCKNIKWNRVWSEYQAISLCLLKKSVSYILQRQVYQIYFYYLYNFPLQIFKFCCFVLVFCYLVISKVFSAPAVGLLNWKLYEQRISFSLSHGPFLSQTHLFLQYIILYWRNILTYSVHPLSSILIYKLSVSRIRDKIYCWNTALCCLPDILKSASVWRTVLLRCAKGTCLSLSRSKWQMCVRLGINKAIRGFFTVLSMHILKLDEDFWSNFILSVIHLWRRRCQWKNL